MPSLYEGFPMVTIESQASGLHLICSENIPTEVKITDLVRFLPLDGEIDVWAETALSCGNLIKDRTLYNKMVIDAGFDLKKLAYEMENFYLSLN